MELQNRNPQLDKEDDLGPRPSKSSLTWVQRRLPFLASIDDEPHAVTRAVFKLGCPPRDREQDYGDLLEKYMRTKRKEGYAAAEEMAWNEAIRMIRYGPRRSYYLAAAILTAGAPILVTAFGPSILSWFGMGKKK